MAKITLNNGEAGATIRANINSMMTDLYSGLSFRCVGTLTSALSGTAVHLLPDATVGAGRKAYITEILLTVNGATAWTDTTGTGVTIQDTSAVVGATFTKVNLTGNAIMSHLSSGVLSSPILLGTGFTTAKGIDIVSDSNFDAGSDIVVTIVGYIA